VFRQKEHFLTGQNLGRGFALPPPPLRR